jgi:hypothetical protein
VLHQQPNYGAKKPPATGIASPVTLKARSGYNERDLREINTLTPGQPTISTDDR